MGVKQLHARKCDPLFVINPPFMRVALMYSSRSQS